MAGDGKLTVGSMIRWNGWNWKMTAKLNRQLQFESSASNRNTNQKQAKRKKKVLSSNIRPSCTDLCQCIFESAYRVILFTAVRGLCQETALWESTTVKETINLKVWNPKFKAYLLIKFILMNKQVNLHLYICTEKIRELSVNGWDSRKIIHSVSSNN